MGHHVAPASAAVTLSATPSTNLIDGQSVQVDVQDSGAGVDPSVRDTLFDAFQGSRGDHAGLGLASVRRILAAQGAEISVASAVGQGTRIRVSWPLADD